MAKKTSKTNKAKVQNKPNKTKQKLGKSIKDINDSSWNIKLINCKINQLTDYLPKNQDVFKLKFDMGKTQLYHIKNNVDFVNYIKACAQHYKNGKAIRNPKKKSIPITDLDVYNILKQYKLISFWTEELNKTNKSKDKQIHYVTKDYDDYIGMYEPADLDSIVNIISQELDLSNFLSLCNNVKARLFTNNLIGDFQEITPPPLYITLTSNGVFNSKTFEFSTDINAFGDFQFISKMPYRILAPSQTEAFVREMALRVLNDWSSNDTCKLTYLAQMAVAAIDGNGREVYNIIIGPGGNGKSAFLSILRQLAAGYSADFNMQDISNDTKLQLIQPNTKVIAGDELPTNTAFVGKMISRLKLLTTNNSIAVDVKFKKATHVQCKGLKIQATNTAPKIFENNDSTARRFKLYPWTITNFTKLGNSAKLDDYIEKTDFIEAFIAVVFSLTEPFDNFIDIKDIEVNSKNMIAGADQIYQFMTYLKEQELLVGILPLNVLYQMYLFWNKNENGNIKPLKSSEFNARLKAIINSFDVILSDSNDRIRLSSLSDIDINIKSLNTKFFDNSLSINKYNCCTYITCLDQITDDDLAEFYTNVLEEADFNKIVTYKQDMMLQHFINKKDPVAISCQQIINDNN